MEKFHEPLFDDLEDTRELELELINQAALDMFGVPIDRLGAPSSPERELFVTKFKEEQKLREENDG